MPCSNNLPSTENSSASVSRRGFVGSAAVAATLAAVRPSASAMHVSSRQDNVVVGLMGLSRGMSLAETFAATPGVTIKYLCEVDSNRLQAAAQSLKSKVDHEIQTTGNFREIVNDPDVDVLVCAAPNHWHAPASIIACNAGKHVYVEKPCSHNPWEGEMLVRAARSNNRCVQMGNQRRSAEKIIAAIKMLHEGRIGEVHYSRSWYANLRGPIGKGTPADVPPHIDYELWQGPAARLPYTSNRLHYNWHWGWHFGNGELGNNGVHSVDLSRWGLNVDYPIRAVSSGGRYFFDDDQQTPDTHLVSFEFEGGKQIMWEGLSCNRMGIDGEAFGTSFHGDNGSLKLTSWGYAVFDQKGKELEKDNGGAADAAHVANFIEAVRAEDPTLLHSEIEEGHKSTLLCHLGNIAQRTGDALECDPSNGHIIGNDDAMKLWKREYAEGWEPEV